MTNYIKHLKETPQNEPIFGSDQVKNNAGGFVWASTWKQFERFVILGSEGGTYYVTERKLSLENMNTVALILNTDRWQEALDYVIKVCQENRAYKKDPALLVFALAMSPEIIKNEAVRQYASDNLPKVAETPRMLSTFVYYADSLRGWGTLLRRSVARWFETKDLNNLVYQTVKYRGGQKKSEIRKGKKVLVGWENRDMIRMSHPKTSDPVRNDLFKWIVKEGTNATNIPESLLSYDVVQGYGLAMSAKDEKELITHINKYHLTWEMIPTAFYKSANVWEALLPNLPMLAMLKNMRNMTELGLFKKKENTAIVLEKLRNEEYIRKSRVHPLQVFLAYTLAEGVPNSVMQALDDAFYMAFKNVEPTGKRYLLGLDVSGSMGSESLIRGLTCRDGAALMAMVTNRVEDFCETMAFTDTFVKFPVQQKESIKSVIDRMRYMDFGRTDCAQPMLYALKHKIPVDVFVVYTDNETWHGNVHPVEALKQYRKKMGIDAKLAVVGMTATQFSIADPNDVGMMDFVGFDTATPQAIASFATL